MAEDTNQHILHILSGDVFGGSEAQMLLQIPALRSLGWSVLVILFNEGETADRFRNAFVPVIICSERQNPKALLESVRGVLNRLSPALIVTHGYKESIVGSLAARYFKIPLAITYHGATENYRGIKRLKMWLYSLIERSVAKRYASSLICVSESLAKVRGIGDDRRLSIVANVAKFSEHSVRDAGYPEKFPGEYWVCGVGRLVPVKRFDRAIDAMGLIADGSVQKRIRFLLVGDGPEKEALQKKIEQAKSISASRGSSLELESLGFRSDAKDIIADSDVLVISSDSEGMPTILLEAMQVGTPVVSTRLSGVQEIKARFPEYPLILTDFTSAGLAEGIDNFLGQGRPEISRALLERIEEEFSPERAARQLGDLYKRILGEHSR